MQACRKDTKHRLPWRDIGANNRHLESHYHRAGGSVPFLRGGAHQSRDWHRTRDLRRILDHSRRGRLPSPPAGRGNFQAWGTLGRIGRLNVGGQRPSVESACGDYVGPGCSRATAPCRWADATADSVDPRRKERGHARATYRNSSDDSNLPVGRGWAMVLHPWYQARRGRAGQYPIGNSAFIQRSHGTALFWEVAESPDHHRRSGDGPGHTCAPNPLTVCNAY